jgi:hypothetical protein
VPTVDPRPPQFAGAVIDLLPHRKRGRGISLEQHSKYDIG